MEQPVNIITLEPVDSDHDDKEPVGHDLAEETKKEDGELSSSSLSAIEPTIDLTDSATEAVLAATSFPAGITIDLVTPSPTPDPEISFTQQSPRRYEPPAPSSSRSSRTDSRRPAPTTTLGTGAHTKCAAELRRQEESWKRRRSNSLEYESERKRRKRYTNQFLMNLGKIHYRRPLK